jgi:hypothetical protein
MKVGDIITKEMISRPSLEEFLENLKQDILRCYDIGHPVFTHGYWKGIVIGGEHKPSLIIQFTDSINSDISSIEKLNI